jgi:heptose I phosphotransferase
MTAPSPTSSFQIASPFQPTAARLGVDGESIYRHPAITIWRSIADRENGYLDFTDDGGHPRRWHVKRYSAVRGQTPAEREVRGIELLRDRGIATVPLVAWGVAADRRSFVLIDDLADHRPCDRLLYGGLPYEPMLTPTADLAARLHAAGLHHRDLYLCHFFAKPEAGTLANLRLIDCARVKALPRLFRQRWVVKDLAQYWYSTFKHPQVSDEHRQRWFDRYATQAAVANPAALLRAVLAKVAWIARHDAKLNRDQPDRNVSIPTISPDGTPNVGRLKDSEPTP